MNRVGLISLELYLAGERTLLKQIHEDEKNELESVYYLVDGRRDCSQKRINRVQLNQGYGSRVKFGTS